MSTPNEYLPLKKYFKALVPAMTEESWLVAESVLRLKTVERMEHLVREGDICNTVSFVNSGLVRMYQLVDGKEKVIGFMNENNYVSEYQSFLTRMPSRSAVQAMERTELVEITYTDLQMLYDKVPEANRLGRIIAENLFMEKCFSDGLEGHIPVLERYERLLDIMPWLPQRVPQYMIASYLGITPEAFSRIKGRKRVKAVAA